MTLNGRSLIRPSVAMRREPQARDILEMSRAGNDNNSIGAAREMSPFSGDLSLDDPRTLVVSSTPVSRQGQTETPADASHMYADRGNSPQVDRGSTSDIRGGLLNGSDDSDAAFAGQIEPVANPLQGILRDSEEQQPGMRGVLEGNGFDDQSDEADGGKNPLHEAAIGKLRQRARRRVLRVLLPVLIPILILVVLFSIFSGGASGGMGAAASSAEYATDGSIVKRRNDVAGQVPRVNMIGDFSSLFDSDDEDAEDASEGGTPEYPTYIATFFGGDEDWTDTLYVSDDCQTFRAVGTVPNEQRDPCIIYHEGRFWVITCLNDEDGNLWLMVSSSTDLKKWVGPTKNGPFSLDRLPAWEFGGAYDVVAPEWYKAPDGSVHVIVSCGFWGYCHGQNWNDHMESYMLDISSFSATGNESRITASGPAKWMSVNSDGDDRIDGNIVFTGGKYYLTIKRHGLWMELWESSTLSPLGWTRIRETCLYGFEAPCVFQTTDGIWHMLADGVPDVEPFGTRRWTAGSLFDTWSPTPITFLRQDGSQVPLGGIRHGTVLPIDKPGQGKAFEAVKQYLPERSTGSKQKDGTLNSKQRAVVDACTQVGSPGANLCAQWVGDVYEHANVGVTFRGYAYQWFYECCKSGSPHNGGTVKTDPGRSTLKPGMVIAVPSSSSGTSAGPIYGHVGIYIGNNQVMHNIGTIATCSVQEWIDTYGKQADVGWGFPTGMK